MPFLVVQAFEEGCVDGGAVAEGERLSTFISADSSKTRTCRGGDGLDHTVLPQGERHLVISRHNLHASCLVA
jgi:hypothetical protein